jgi:hypothetical protein
MGAFDALLAERGIPLYWTYPKSPKMNAHNERFNRTIQDQFIDHHEELLFSDLALFNHHLALWLIDSKPRSPTTPSVSNPQYNGSSIITPSAIGTGPIQDLENPSFNRYASSPTGRIRPAIPDEGRWEQSR